MSTAFAVALPSDWVRIDLTDDDPEHLTQSVARSVAVLTDAFSPAVTAALSPMLQASVEGAREQQAQCLILGLRPMPFTMVIRPFASQTPLDDLVALAAVDPTATLVDVPQLACLRTTRTRQRSTVPPSVELVGIGLADADIARLAAGTSQDLRYVLGHPGQPDWVEVIASAALPDDADEVMMATATELADAVVTSFRWLS